MLKNSPNEEVVILRYSEGSSQGFGLRIAYSCQQREYASSRQPLEARSFGVPQDDTWAYEWLIKILE
jgi:hypothetical protein